MVWFEGVYREYVCMRERRVGSVGHRWVREGWQREGPTCMLHVLEVVIKRGIPAI